MTGRDREKLKLIDSIDTCGMSVMQMVELNDEFLLVVGHMCDMRLYKRGPSNLFSKSQEEKKNISTSVDQLLRSVKAPMFNK